MCTSLGRMTYAESRIRWRVILEPGFGLAPWRDKTFRDDKHNGISRCAVEAAIVCCFGGVRLGYLPPVGDVQFGSMFFFLLWRFY